MIQIDADSLASIYRSPGTANYTTQMKHLMCLGSGGMESILFLPIFYPQWSMFLRKNDISSILSATLHRVSFPTLFSLLPFFIPHWLTDGRQLEEINFS
jgi:hypothetical protein